MGVQHQHHSGELRQTGKHSKAFMVQTWFKLLIYMIWSGCFHSTQAQEGQVWGNFYSKMSEEAQKFPIDQINDRELKLQLISLQDKGSGALSPDKAAHVRQSLHV